MYSETKHNFNMAEIWLSCLHNKEMELNKILREFKSHEKEPDPKLMRELQNTIFWAALYSGNAKMELEKICKREKRKRRILFWRR